MSYFPDLGTVTMAAAGPHVRAIGWLDADYAYETGRRLPVGWYADAMPLARNFCPAGALLRAARDEARRIAGDAGRPLAERADAEQRLSRAETRLAGACAPRAIDYVLWVLGIGLSVLALALFAMIWFDVLRRFVTLRSSGNPPPALG